MSHMVNLMLGIAAPPCPNAKHKFQLLNSFNWKRRAIIQFLFQVRKSASNVSFANVYSALELHLLLERSRLVNKGSGSDIYLETFKVEFPWRHAEIRKREVVSRLQPSQGLGSQVLFSRLTEMGYMKIDRIFPQRIVHLVCGNDNWNHDNHGWISNP